MKNNTVNPYDLSVVKEVLPLLRLRLKMMVRRISRPASGTGKGTLFVVPCILGDCLSYLPAIRAYAEKNHTTFDIIVSPDFRSLAEHIKGVRHVFVARSSYNRPSERGHRSEHDIPPAYDEIIVLRLSPEAYGLIRHVKCRRIISSDAALLKYVLHMAGSSLLQRPVTQSREMMFDPLGLHHVSRTDLLYSLFDIDSDRCDILTRYPELQCLERKVLIHTGSGWGVKLWDDDRWVALLEMIRRLGPYQFFFVGKGEQEMGALERIRRRLSFDVRSFVDQLSLWDLFLVMQQSDYMIGIDSGPRNLAHYAGLRSVTLLNPAAVKNFMPFDNRDMVVEKPNRLPANIVNTMKDASLADISVDEVFEAFRTLTMRDRAIAPSGQITVARNISGA